MRRFARSLKRTFNWDVVVRLALVPTVAYVVIGAALGETRRAARDAVVSAVTARVSFGR
jgi:hypothetical protein